MKIIVGISGASGAIYAKKLLQYLEKQNVTIDIIFTKYGYEVWRYELEEEPEDTIKNIKIYSNEDLFASPASGTSNYDAMVICPCSMGTIGKIANCVTDNLLTRAADVILKENKKLILVPRETPLNTIHLQNLLKLSQAGALICPAMPSFYSKPSTVNEVVDTVIQKILNLLNFDVKLIKW